MKTDKEEVKRLLAGKWDILFSPYLRPEKQKKNQNGQLNCLCPFHNDKEPSLSINTQDGLFHCFSCGAKGDGFDFLKKVKKCTFQEALQEAAEKVGLGRGPVPKKSNEKLTVTQLAKDKNIPEEFLRNRMGLKEKDGGVLIPYLDTKGETTLRQRKRTAVSGKEGSAWFKGKEPIGPYGIWALPKLREIGKDYLIIVEGESDVWTLWLSGFPAIGLPGANMAGKLKSEHVKGFEKIFIWKEPDQGGETFVQGIQKRLKEIGFTRQVFIIQSKEAKDPNELYKKHENFKEKFGKVIKEGKTLKESPVGRTAKIITLSDVPPEEVEWLWWPYIPKKKLTIMEGDPGEGKTFLALQVAAAISRGWPLPDQEGKMKKKQESEPGKVIYLSAEDGIGDTLRPRLDQMGADPERIHVLTGWRNEEEETEGEISLKDLPLIAQAMETVKPNLIVIDPIQGFLGAGTDMNKAEQVRPLLAGLSNLAKHYGASALCIRHLTKANLGKSLYRGLGSIDFTAAARSVLMVGSDPDNPQEKVLIQIKNSLEQKGTSLTFELREQGFFWTGITDLMAPDLNGFEQGREDKTALEEAEDFLLDYLSEGPQEPKEIKRQAKATGISEMTLRRAREKLKIKGEKVDRFTWHWVLPAQQKEMNKLNKLVEPPENKGFNQVVQPAHSNSDGQVEGDFEEGVIE